MYHVLRRLFTKLCQQSNRRHRTIVTGIRQSRFECQCLKIWEWSARFWFLDLLASIDDDRETMRNYFIICPIAIA